MSDSTDCPDTSGDFQLFSFSMGASLAISTLILILQINRYKDRRTLVAHSPTITSLFLLLQSICYCVYLVTGEVAANASSSVTEFIAKMFTLYYLSFRVHLLIVSHYANMKIMFRSVIVSSVIVLIVAEGCGMALPYVTSDDLNITLQLIYDFSDLYLSIVEFWSCYVYIKYRYERKDRHEIWNAIKEWKMEYQVYNGYLYVFLCLLYGVLSTQMFIGGTAFDQDCQIYGAFMSIKYAYACNFASDIYGLNNKKKITNKSESKMETKDKPTTSTAKLQQKGSAA